MIEVSTDSTPRLWAGGPSMIIFIHRICIALRGFGRFKAVVSATSPIAATEVLISM